MASPSPTRSHFKKEASYWRDVYWSETVEGAIYETRRRKALALVDALRLKPGARVLEIGCGSGPSVAELARRGFHVFGTDIVEEMLLKARELVEREPVAGRFALSCADAQVLPFRDGAFDLIVGLGILEWVHSAELTVAEMDRVLQPGGHVVLGVSNMWALPRWTDPRLNPFAERLKRWAKANVGVLRHKPRARSYSPREVDRMFEAAGLQKEQSFTLGFGPFTFLTKKLIPGRWGIRIHHALQRAADAGTPVLRKGGHVYLVQAAKPAGGVLDQKRTGTLL